MLDNFFISIYLLDDFLAVIIEELIHSVRQELVLAIEQIVHPDEDLTNSEVYVEVVHPEPPLLALEDLGLAPSGERPHTGGEGAAALEGEDEDLALDLVQPRHVHLGHGQPDSECAAEET